MPIFPLNLMQLLGPAGAYVVYLAIGFAFGWSLEIAGFGSSPKLAAQFYFRDMTVLKVMFTAIVVAMVLIAGASALGLLDYNLIWVNPTYLWPGIVGGLIMGVGFILGGYCPGTSLVGAATAKIDAMFFVLGAFVGVFIFAETVDMFSIFWTSSDMGRVTLPEVFGLPTGVVVLLLVLMALFMFWGSEQLERIFGKRNLKREPKARYAGALVLVLGAVVVALIGQPTLEDRWSWIAPEREAQLSAREVQIHPGELITSMHDHHLRIVMLDVRSESDYNQFHLEAAQNISLVQLVEIAPELLRLPGNTVVVVMSNGEQDATQAWRDLVASGVPNVYILEGGLNGWLDLFAAEESSISKLSAPIGDEDLGYRFGAALGAHYSAASPLSLEIDIEFEPKIELEIKRGPVGKGCG